MGENSPWLTIIEGSDSGRSSRSTWLCFFVSVVHGINESAWSSRDQKPCGLFSPNDATNQALPCPRRWCDPGELVRFIVIALPALELRFMFCTNTLWQRTCPVVAVG